MFEKFFNSIYNDVQCIEIFFFYEPARLSIFNRNSIRLSKNKRAADFSDKYSFLKENIAQIVLERLNGHFASVLDLGCHSGQVEKILKKYITYECLYQCDSSEKMLEQIDNEYYKINAYEDIPPFKNESFDLVVSVMSMHSINNLQYLIDSVYDILKPGGLFIGTVFGPSTLLELKRAGYMVWGEDCRCRFYPSIEVKKAGQLISSTKFSMCSSDSSMINIEYDDITQLFIDLRGMSETGGLNQTCKTKVTVSDLREIKNNYRGNVAAFEIICITGMKSTID